MPHRFYSSKYITFHFVNAKTKHRFSFQASPSSICLLIRLQTQLLRWRNGLFRQKTTRNHQRYTQGSNLGRKGTKNLLLKEQALWRLPQTWNGYLALVGHAHKQPIISLSLFKGVFHIKIFIDYVNFD